MPVKLEPTTPLSRDKHGDHWATALHKNTGDVFKSLKNEKKSWNSIFWSLYNPDIVGEKLIWLFLLYLYINYDLHLIYFTFWHCLEP